MKKEKEYVKCHLVGDDKNLIIAEFDKCWDTHDSRDTHDSSYFKKGKDLITGTPLILGCWEHSFSYELAWYGFNRIYRLGARSRETISKQDALNFLKSMTIEDAQVYSQTIKQAKKKHFEMIKKHIMSVLKEKQLAYQDNIEVKVQQAKARMKTIALPRK